MCIHFPHMAPVVSRYSEHSLLESKASRRTGSADGCKSGDRDRDRALAKALAQYICRASCQLLENLQLCGKEHGKEQPLQLFYQPFNK